MEGQSLDIIFRSRAIKTAYMKYLRFTSNPADVSTIYDIDPILANEIREEGHGAKIEAVISVV